MAAEDVRLFRGALLLRRFTLRELQEHAGVKANTAGSWLKRNRGVLQEMELDRRNEGPGRPKKTWLLSADGEGKFREALDAFQLTNPQPEPAPSPGLHLSRLNDLLERWRRLRRGREDSTGEIVRSAARLRLRVAWEGLAEMDLAGYSIAFDDLRALAHIEAAFDFGTPWADSNLETIAGWIVNRIWMKARVGVAPHFAARVLRARAEASGHPMASRLTAAAMAAQVWADEDFARAHNVPISAIRACIHVLDDIPLNLQLEQVLQAVDAARGLGVAVTAFERQTVVLGVAHLYRLQHKASQNSEIADWLLALPRKTIWSDELAPAVVYGSLDAGHVKVPQVLASLGDSLSNALRASRNDPSMRDYPNSIRTAAHDYSRRILASMNVYYGRIAA
jgi:hypothetical protein